MWTRNEPLISQRTGPQVLGQSFFCGVGRANALCTWVRERMLMKGTVTSRADDALGSVAVKGIGGVGSMRRVDSSVGGFCRWGDVENVGVKMGMS